VTMSKKLIRKPWESAITEVKPNELITYGVNQRQIIREFSFEETVFFLLMGRKPNTKQRNMLRAVLTAYVSHGITGQSTLAVMQAADCGSDFLSALVAGFLVGSGKYHQGALYGTMTEIQNMAKLSESQVLNDIRLRVAKGERIIGFGHRFHSRDPRAETLIEIAAEEGFDGIHLRTAKLIEDVLITQKGIAMNLGAAAGGILLDLGFDPAIAALIVVLGRSTMYAAVYLERLAQRKDPFQKIEISDLEYEEDNT